MAAYATAIIPADGVGSMTDKNTSLSAAPDTDPQVIIAPDGSRWATRCSCALHRGPDRQGHSARPLP